MTIHRPDCDVYNATQDEVFGLDDEAPNPSDYWCLPECHEE